MGMKMWRGLLVAVVAAASALTARAGVLELSGNNFEHLTQAATGATTGDWFVKFYAPWCGHCKRLAPTWEDLADELQGEVNVAKVDADQEAALGNRFGIKGYPTLMYFHHGTMYKYSGSRDVDSMAEFARTLLDREIPVGYEGEGRQVPPEPGMRANLWEEAKKLPVWQIILAGTAGGVLGGGIIWLIFRPRGSMEEVEAAITKEIDEMVARKLKEAEKNKKKTKGKAEETSPEEPKKTK